MRRVSRGYHLMGMVLKSIAVIIKTNKSFKPSTPTSSEVSPPVYAIVLG